MIYAYRQLLRRIFRQGQLSIDPQQCQHRQHQSSHTERCRFSKGSKIKCHIIFPAGIENGYRTDERDMPHGADYVEWDTDRIMRWARSIGSSTAVVIEKILSSRAIVEQSFNSALAVLRMTRRYTKEAIEKASGEALFKTDSPQIPPHQGHSSIFSA